MLALNYKIFSLINKMRHFNVCSLSLTLCQIAADAVQQ